MDASDLVASLWCECMLTFNVLPALAVEQLLLRQGNHGQRVEGRALSPSILEAVARDAHIANDRIVAGHKVQARLSRAPDLVVDDVICSWQPWPDPGAFGNIALPAGTAEAVDSDGGLGRLKDLMSKLMGGCLHSVMIRVLER